MTDFLNDLNENQREAVVNYKGPNLIIAGAGSGKTRVLTYRIAYLLAQGVFAGNIMALTFTNKAAKEMKERIISLVGFSSAKYLWMGTFHSLFAKILRIESEKIGFTSKFTIYDTDDSRSLLKSIIKDLQLDDKLYKVSEVHGRISMAKNNLITSSTYLSSPVIQEQDKASRKPEIGKIFAIYMNRLKASDSMDFDDLLMYTNILLRDNPEITEKYQNQFQFLLVDEYQDTNYAQYLIIKRLSAKHNNICVVGDDSQSIYAFRGAKIENILNFKKDYPENKLYKLEQNYRSTKTIVNAANSLITHNRGRIPKTIWSNNEAGEKIKVQKALTDAEEGYIISNILQDYQERNKFKYSDFAILYRINAQSRTFEEAFRRKGIPYKVYGGMSFYQRKEIKDVLAYFRLIINKNDDEAFKRIINFPARGIGKTTLEKIELIALSNEISMWTVISDPKSLSQNMASGTQSKIMNFRSLISHFSERLYQTDAFELANYIVSHTGILRELESEKSQEGITRKQNVEELLNAIKDYSVSSLAENPEESVYLDSFLESVSLQTESETNEENPDHVSLMTVHSAKGLEFNCVFVVGAEQELFPLHFNGVSPEDLEEERRLFYVALTRAKKIANISFAEHRYKWGQLISCQPSRFIDEIDKQYLDLPLDSAKIAEPVQYQHKEIPKSIKLQSEMLKPAISLSIKQKKLVHLNVAEKKANTSEMTTDKSEVIEGMQVIHDRFGKGTVVKIEGQNPNTKALIQFEVSGEKQLLLKFAKLKIIHPN